MSMSSKRTYSDQKITRGGRNSTKRPKISNRRPCNRYKLEKPSLESVSTSAKKLSDINFNDFKVTGNFGYRILNFLAVFFAISEAVVCKKCKSDVTFRESGKRGLGFKLVISCKNSDEINIPSCSLIDKGYDINRRIVLAMRLLGVGLIGIIKFCAFMDLPRSIFQSFYDVVVKKIAIEAKAVCNLSMKIAAEKGKEKTEDQSDSTVSGGDPWSKRGFSSVYGLVSLIGWHTGKVVDVLVEFKYCKACEVWKTKTDTIEFEEWSDTHKDECQANHVGSAGKMEVDAVIEMFERSESLHNLKHANYVGDGDSNTFKGILDSESYKEFTVQKKECIDHVQKRMGSHLRDPVL